MAAVMDGEVGELGETSVAASLATRREWPADLVLIEFAEPGCPAEVRRRLRELTCLREIVMTGRTGRAWTDPGAGPALARAFRSLGLDLAVVTLQWQRDRPFRAPRPSCTATAVSPVAITCSAGEGTGMLTKLIVVTANPDVTADDATGADVTGADATMAGAVRLP
ncbi:hypothetical protein [Planotetraspora kaengkrachanensis]|uniref:Uncharacterized protein n=1 Tax=Planotetraspora kaengkrachanensis TaxID=575193 RepID=A0A8J3M2C7_9ACTN|nr:hypothetical protein [Planotetraspora kaengkrachanensis]GIG78069.1 hypothetical protein Pka01_11960 [Planotetraspora kaengkrachanensis]